MFHIMVERDSVKIQEVVLRYFHNWVFVIEKNYSN